MATMDEEERRARAERLRLHLKELRSRLDPPSYQLMLRILQGVNTALAAGGGDAEIDMPETEKELFTPELQRELRTVMGLLDFAEDSVVIDLGDGGAPSGGVHSGGGAAERAAELQRATDRREVESIARASGMRP